MDSVEETLLNVQNDDALTKICAENEEYQKICSNDTFWQKRLEKYYPWTLFLKQETITTWQQLYFAISLWRQYLRASTKDEPDCLKRLKKHMNLIDQEVNKEVNSFVFDPDDENQIVPEYKMSIQYPQLEELTFEDAYCTQTKLNHLRQFLFNSLLSEIGTQ